MTIQVDQALRVPPTLRAADAPVVVGACHDLTDVAMVALVEKAGYRACIADLRGVRVLGPATKVVLARRAEHLDYVGPAKVIGIGVNVDRAGGIALADSPYSAGSLRSALDSIVGSESTGRSGVHLSRREHEVLTTYALGSSVRDTAARHFIAESTVRSHFRRVIGRYLEAGRPVSNRAQLLVELIVDGWVDRERMLMR